MKVPVIDNGPPRETSLRPIDSTYSNLDFRDGTDALVRGVGQLSQGVDDVVSANAERAAKAKKKADDTAADSLFTQAQAFTTPQLHGYDSAPQPKPGPAGADTLTDEDISSVGAPGQHQPGYLDTVGTQAHEQSGQTLETIQKKYDSLLAAAGNDEQRRLVRERMATMFEGVRTQVAEHEGKQFKVAQQAATQGLLDTTLDTAANMYDKPRDLAPLVDDALASLKRTTLPEEYEAKKQDYLSKTSQVMIGAYLQHGDIVGAAARYGADEKMLGKDGERVKAKIDEAMKAHVQGTKDIEGANAAKAAFDGAVNQKTSWVDPVKARAEVEKLPEGPVKVAANLFLEHRLNVAKQEKQQAVDNTFANALAAYQKTGTLAGVAAADKLWLQNPANKVGESDAWEKLKAVARADAEHVKGVPPTKDQQRAMTQYLVDLHDHPDKYATMSEADYNANIVPGLAKSDRERAGAALATAHSQASKPGQLSPDETKMLLQTGRSAGLFPDKVNDVSKWEDGEAELYYQASKDLTEWATTYRKQNGKAPPFEEVKKQAAELVLKGKDPERGFLGFGGNTTRLEAEAKGTGFEPKFSSDEKAKAAAALQRRGGRADDAAVDALLRRAHKLPALPIQAAPEAPAKAEQTPDIPGPTDLPGAD